MGCSDWAATSPEGAEGCALPWAGPDSHQVRLLADVGDTDLFQPHLSDGIITDCYCCVPAEKCCCILLEVRVTPMVLPCSSLLASVIFFSCLMARSSSPKGLWLLTATESLLFAIRVVQGFMQPWVRRAGTDSPLAIAELFSQKKHPLSGKRGHQVPPKEISHIHNSFTGS